MGKANNPLLERLFTWLQYSLPQHTLSRLMLHATRIEHEGLKNLGIRQFLKYYDVDLEEAQLSDPYAYPSFNAFFTRPLRDGARRIASERGAVVCPADGTISEAGTIAGKRLLQAKGISYSLKSLMAGDRGLSARFTNGEFITIYLAPHNYHRVHMPYEGTLRSMVYLPGRLYSVNAGTTRNLRGIFVRNERVICLFETKLGPMAVILVGALFVGSIDTVWAGTVAPGKPRKPQRWVYPTDGEGCIQLARGAELGRFNIGSTVIVLFAENRVRWEGLETGATVRVAQRIGTRLESVPQPPAIERT